MTLFLLLQLYASTPPLPTPQEALSRINIVIGAGHGGINPGRVFPLSINGERKNFVEKFYNCDIVVRGLGILASFKASAIPTTMGPCMDEPHGGDLLQGATWAKDEQFTSNGEVVSQGSIHERDVLAGLVATNSSMPTVHLEIHLDYAWKSDIRGAFVLVPKGRSSSRLAQHLIRILGPEVGLQDLCKAPIHIIENDSECYERDLHILRHHVVKETLILELTNIRNEEDRTKMLDPAWRQKCAELIVQALINYATELYLEAEL